MRTSGRSAWVAACVVVASGCGSASRSQGSDATVAVTVNALGTVVATVVITVDAADIDPPLVFNLTLEDGIAVGTLRMPPGAMRTVSAVAYDGGGAIAAEGSVTLATVERGPNPHVSIPMVSRAGQVPLSIQIGAVSVAITPPSATLAVDETLQLAARITAASGGEISDAPAWATTDPTVLRVTAGGLVTALREGQADIVATYAGVAGLSRISVGATAPWIGVKVIGAGSPSAVAVDAARNTYVAGATADAFPGFTNSGGSDAFVAKLDASGSVVWVKQLGTAGNEDAVGVAVDAEGTTWLLGTTDGAFPGYTNAGQRDAFVATIDASGAVSVKQVGTPGDDQGVATGPLGTTYVSGLLLGTRAFIAVLDPAGELAWYEELDPTVTYNKCDRLVVDARGDAYLSGELLSTTVPPWSAVFVAKARVGAGAPTTTRLANDANVAYRGGLAVDGEGSSYVVGLQENVGSWEAFAAKLGPDLTPVWGPTLPFGFDTDAMHVALDAHGDLYVAGTTGSYYDFVDASIAKLDASGNVRWPPKTFATAGSPYHLHSAEASAADLQGNVYVAGRTEAGVVVAKFDALGLLQ